MAAPTNQILHPIIQKFAVISSEKLFDHCRLHAQALTLAALVGSGLVEYYDREYGSSGPKVDRYTRQYMSHSHKD